MYIIRVKAHRIGKWAKWHVLVLNLFLQKSSIYTPSQMSESCVFCPVEWWNENQIIFHKRYSKAIIHHII